MSPSFPFQKCSAKIELSRQSQYISVNHKKMIQPDYARSDVDSINAKYAAWGVAPAEAAREEVPTLTETRYYQYNNGQWIHIWTSPSYHAFMKKELDLLKQTHPTLSPDSMTLLASQTFHLYQKTLELGIQTVLNGYACNHHTLS